MTLNDLLDIPPISSNVTSTNPVSSEPVYCLCVNLTVIAMHDQYDTLKVLLHVGDINYL